MNTENYNETDAILDIATESITQANIIAKSYLSYDEVLERDERNLCKFRCAKHVAYARRAIQCAIAIREDTTLSYIVDRAMTITELCDEDLLELIVDSIEVERLI